MRIAIVEDNADVRAQLCGFVKQYAAESGTPLEVETFPDGSAHPGGGPECGAGLCDQHGPVRHPRL